MPVYCGKMTTLPLDVSSLTHSPTTMTKTENLTCENGTQSIFFCIPVYQSLLNSDLYQSIFPFHERSTNSMSLDVELELPSSTSLCQMYTGRTKLNHSSTQNHNQLKIPSSFLSSDFHISSEGDRIYALQEAASADPRTRMPSIERGGQR
jgi:hypothetical protein